MTISEIFRKQNIKKSYLVLRNQGIRTFFEKAKAKLAVAKAETAKPVKSNTQDMFPADSKEKKLAKSYIQAVAKNPASFVDFISPDDEMYLFTQQLVSRKETAAYLYFEAGRECLNTVKRIMYSSGKTCENIRSFLDFACGYGRLVRFLIQEIDPHKVWASDIYRRAVDFQKKYFKVNGFYSKTEPHRLKFPQKFEVIYAGSLFSHLPANRFGEWLSRLYETLEEDGILIFSTHGESLCPEGVQMDPSGFTFLKQSESSSLSSEEYGSAYVSRDWVQTLSQESGIREIYYFAKELCECQDVYVAAKKAMPALGNLHQQNYIKGYIDSMLITEDMDLYMNGWAFERETGAPVKNICIYADSEELGKATLGTARPDVAHVFERPGCLNSGWEFQGGRAVIRKLFESGDENFFVIAVLIENHGGDVKCLISPCDMQIAYRKKSVESNMDIWSSYAWTGKGDEWSAEWGGSDYLWHGTIFPRIRVFLPADSILEIAPGYGRCTQYLLPLCRKLSIVDLSENCIKACQKRFEAHSHIQYFVNDGKSLDMIQDDSIDFVFSWDSLVHVESDAMFSYLQHLSCKLKPGGFGFIHHSNMGSFTDPETGQLQVANPGWRASSMTADLFREYCGKTGLTCLSQEIITWGDMQLSDCLSLFTRELTKTFVEPVIYENTDFMKEAMNLKRISMLYNPDSPLKNSRRQDTE